MNTSTPPASEAERSAAAAIPQVGEIGRPVPPASPALVPVVAAIGASAGGLAALEQMLPRVPPGAGVAWIYAQHLDPVLQTQLVPVLQRLTPMPVREATDGLYLHPGQLVTIPADAALSVVAGRCRLQPLSADRGRRQTLDWLFDSLARDLGPRAVGVLLSGVGSDGCAGLQAIQAAGGLTLAQLPQTAQFDAMPRSAMALGAVDIVAPAAELPARLLQALAARKLIGPLAPQDEAVALWVAPGPVEPVPGGSAGPAMHGGDADEGDNGDGLGGQAQRLQLMTILQRLRERGEHDFTLYKPSTLLRRIRRRMDVHRIGSMPEYARMLEINDAEPRLLAQELLIGVTGFFRDPGMWQWLRDEGLPRLLREREDGWRLRAWVAGCSTGEEAYSLAMTFREVLDTLPERRRCTLQVFATDLSAAAIERARRGVYAAAREDVSSARQARFFVPHGLGLKIHPEIREMVVFATHDLNRDPPFTRLDLLSCRNLLIYLTAPLQRRLLPLFHYSLWPGGLLLLGSSETIGRYEDLFEIKDARLRVYRRGHAAHDLPLSGFSWQATLATAEPAKETPMSEDAPERPLSNLQAVADRWLMQRLAPPLVLVNGSGDIVYISGRTGRYLEPAAGQANWNVHVMARAGLRAALSDALERARTAHTVVEVDDLPLESVSGPPAVGLRIEPLDEPAQLQGLWLIVFREVPARVRRRRTGAPPGAAVEAEMARAREESQSLREEMRASQEELQAANEELQSTNEELQSTNEELTSSKDEMHAMNDELQDVNAALKAKLVDLAQAQADVRNLLLGMDVVMLLVDRDLRLRCYSEAARQQFGLNDGSLGLPLAALGEAIGLPDVVERTQDMLRTLVVTRHAFSGRDGRTTSVRMMPYRSLDNVIDGAVLAFS